MMKESFKITSYSYFHLSIITLLVVTGCAYFVTDKQKRQKIEKMYVEYKKEFPEVQDLDPQQAMQLSEYQKVVFVDVRKAEEQKVSMLPGAIASKAFLKNPEKYKDYIKIGYCTISYRSGKFAQTLKQKEIIMYNLRGGMLSWVHDGGKVYNENRKTNAHVFRLSAVIKNGTAIPAKYFETAASPNDTKPLISFWLNSKNTPRKRNNT